MVEFGYGLKSEKNWNFGIFEVDYLRNNKIESAVLFFCFAHGLGVCDKLTGRVNRAFLELIGGSFCFSREFCEISEKCEILQIQNRDLGY